MGQLRSTGEGATTATTVLVVDDDPSVRALVCAWLGKANIQCIQAQDGSSAVELAALHAASLDCIILDIMMPGLDGFQVLERLAATPTTQNISAILLTARVGSEEDVVRALDVGAVDYLEKPFSGRVLVAKVLAATQRRQRERALQGALAFAEAHAAIDALTGIFNRQHLNQRLREEAALATRHQRPYTVILLDLDHFKAINDTFGHPDGDRVLVHVADVMKSALREEDCAFRYGGEEFVLILRNCSVTAGMVVAWRLRQALRDRRIRLGQEVPRVITFSAGIASANALNGFNSEDLLGRADRALYRAKRAGRDRAELEHDESEGPSLGFDGAEGDISGAAAPTNPVSAAGNGPVSSAIRPAAFAGQTNFPELVAEEDKRVS